MTTATIGRIMRVGSLPASAAHKGTTVALTTDGHLYTWDGTAWVDNGASGGGGGGGLTAAQARTQARRLALALGV